MPLTLACIAMVVRVVLASTGHVGDAFLDVVIVVVAALIVVRHLMEMWENRSLTQALEVKVGELTAREAELSHQALHDPLTGLANRRLFGDRVDHALERSRRTGERTAVLFIDLDDFKTVNDSLGHPAGDQLLVGVATRISACVRPGDTVARLGGDEFGIVMEGLASPDEAAVVAARVLDALEIAFPLDGRQVFTKASIGVAHADSAPGARGEQVLADADAALYEAKANGKATFRQFEEEMRESVVARLEIIQDLRGVSAPGQFVCHYQPIVELSTGRTVAVEALVRWDHPARGLLGPSSFIALAEETGVIVELGLEVVRQATTQVAQWWARGDLPEDLELHVNLSGRQLEQSDLAAQICAVVDTAGFPRPAGLGDHREHRRRHRSSTPGTAGRTARDRDSSGHRRLRDRLLVAELPADPARRRIEGRPDLRRHHRRCHRPGPDGGHRQVGRFPRHRRDRRGNRAR
ncbi:MAG: diguanylate cyclase [Microthrixaceae bacterium]|nr:diguanylate cyclase [Microthrixaceae bacterium]